MIKLNLIVCEQAHSVLQQHGTPFFEIKTISNCLLHATLVVSFALQPEEPVANLLFCFVVFCSGELLVHAHIHNNGKQKGGSGGRLRANVSYIV